MEALVIGPVVSELGWELMEWQGYCRAKAAGIDKQHVVVCTTSGREFLYSDFAGYFISHNIRCDRDGHKPRNGKVKNPSEIERVTRLLREYSQNFRAQGCNVGWLKSWGVGSNVPNHFDNQKFVKYGVEPFDDDHKFKMVLHARNVAIGGPCSGDNYPRGMWIELIDKLVDAGLAKYNEIAAIGVRDAALCPDGVVDMRDVDLTVLTNIMHHARLVIGPSSGPMHLASLCGTPHYVWATGKFQSLMPKGNEVRYREQWNPFNTPVDIVLHDKGKMIPPVILANNILQFVDDLYGEVML